MSCLRALMPLLATAGKRGVRGGGGAWPRLHDERDGRTRDGDEREREGKGGREGGREGGMEGGMEGGRACTSSSRVAPALE